MTDKKDSKTADKKPNRREFIGAGAAGLGAMALSQNAFGQDGSKNAANFADNFRDDYSYMMPAHFGGRPGGMTATVYHDTISATLWYDTDAKALESILPNGFKLERPEVMVAAIMNRGIEWMLGETYNIVAVNVPVRFKGKKDDVEGWYSLVVWENNTTPILTGREQTGIPKIYSEVEHFRFLGDEMRTWTHHAGHSFCDLHFTSIRDANSAERKFIDENFSKMNWMAWRYIPNIGPNGGAALSEATIYPQEFESTKVRLTEAKVNWSVPPIWKNPTQAHIIKALADLPIKGYSKPAVIMNAKNILRGDLARILR